MENNEPVTPAATPAPAAAQTQAEPSLADYRATREPSAAKTNVQTAAAAAPAPAKAADPMEPGDPVIDEGDGETPAGMPENAEVKTKKLGGYQKIIARQAAEIEALKKSGTAAATPGTPEPPPPPTPAAAAAKPAAPELVYAVAKPKLEDCATLEEFTEKLADWTADRRDWLKESRAGQAAAQAAVKARADGWNANVAAFKVEHNDWDAVMAAVAEIKLSGAHQQIFLDSPHGVALAYELAQDPAELERIAKLPPLAAARAIGKLEAAFGPERTGGEDDADAARTNEKEIKVSGAPPPFKPLNGATNRGTPNPATMSIADYRKARESGRIH
jgi:hypothetical protein